MNMELTNSQYIRELLGRHGFHFSKSMGQNFLTAAWVPEDIAAAGVQEKGMGVLEVGPGIGCLTRELSKRADKVLAVELDKALRPILAETLADCENVEIVYGDVLKQNIPALAEEKLGGLKKAVCANLPYNVTSPLLTAFIEAGCFDTITVMIQREVAKRICASPGCSDYGAFGIFVQWHMETELLFDVPPSCFMPQPKVTSSVIRLKKRAGHPVQVLDEQMMFRVIRAAFNQRRKTLVNALSSQLGNITKEETERAIVNCGFDTRIRGEVLDIGGFAKISDEIVKIMRVDL